MASILFKNELDSLIENLAAGSEEAFTELYHQTSAGVYAYALSILKNAHDAEDVLHDCYIRIHESAVNYQSQGKPMAWIFTIARNLCFKLLEQKKNIAQLPFDPATEMWDPDDKLLVEACLKILTDEERQIVVLHAVAGMKHRQIGEFLSLPLSTVLSKYHRSIKKMRTHLGKE